MSPTESSEQASKRLRKERLYIQAALRKAQNGGVRIEEEHLNEVTSDDSNELSGDIHSSPTPMAKPTPKSRKTRGPTRCDAIVNAHGDKWNQPIGDTSVTLSSYMGRLTREIIPITYNDWKFVPDMYEELLWEAIKQKFVIDDDAKDVILQQCGNILRAYKTRLANGDGKPDHIDFAQWETFTKKRATKEFMVKSMKFKEMRKKQEELPYTGSQKSFARMDEELIPHSLVGLSRGSADIQRKKPNSV